MKLWPARSKHTKVELVADFDAMVQEPVNFKLNGKIHSIDPITTKEFFAYANAYAKLMQTLEEKRTTIPPKELMERYFEVLKSVCSSITLEDVESATNAQMGALFQLVIETVTGKSQADQKKTLQAMMTAAKMTEGQQSMQ